MSTDKGRHRRTRTVSAVVAVGVAAGGAGVYLAAAPDDADAAAPEPVVVSTTAELEKAFADARPGTTIELRGGTYHPTKSLKSQANGTAESRITVTASGTEKVTVDGSKLGEGQWLVAIGGDHWTLSDLTFRNSPGHGVVATSSVGGVFENLTTHGNGASGFTLRGDGTNDNLILNLDSHDNYDPETHGQHADGLAIKFGSGSNNRVVGARLFNNADDGVDLWHWASPVRVEDSWAYGNGVNRWDDAAFEGNGNGFKLGGGGTNAEHVIVDNAAWNNVQHGFTANGNHGRMQLRHNSAYRNGADGYFFLESPARLSRNLSVRNGSGAANLGNRAVLDANSWAPGSARRVPELRSTDPSTAYGPRRTDGSLPRTKFLTTRAPFGADMGDASPLPADPSAAATPTPAVTSTTPATPTPAATTVSPADPSRSTTSGGDDGSSGADEETATDPATLGGSAGGGTDPDAGGTTPVGQDQPQDDLADTGAGEIPLLLAAAAAMLVGGIGLRLVRRRTLDRGGRRAARGARS